jgi:RNA polymerase sigma-70 factor (ECF subfamily)
MPVDTASFELALEDAIEPAHRLACGMVHDPQAAEDLVQEAAVKAWRKRDQLRPGAALRPWFLAIVANECRRHFRLRWTSVLKLADVVVESRSDDLDARADLRRELLRLKADDRLVIVLHIHLDMSLEDVAAVMGKSPSAVRGRFYRAIGKLRIRLELQEAVR